MIFDYSNKLDSDGFFSKEADVHAWCKAMGIKKYNYAYSDFHQAMALSVNGSVNLENKLDQLSQLPVLFDKVEANLWLERNQLTSLVGLPKTCHTVSLYNNPFFFETLMPLSRVEKLEKLYLPIELKKELQAKGIQFYKNDVFIVIEEVESFQSLLKKIEQQQKQQAFLAENKASFIVLNQSFKYKKYGNR